MKYLSKFLLFSFVFVLSFFSFNLALANPSSVIQVDVAGGEDVIDSYTDDYYRNNISADGRYVTYESGASNLVEGDTGGFYDIFLYDTETNTTTRVSVSSAGVQGNNSSSVPSMSADGKYIVYASDATNLVEGDTNGIRDVFLYDTETNTTTRVSVSSAGAQGNSGSNNAIISPDGKYVSYYSGATNLVEGDLNGVQDVFLYEIDTGITSLVSVSSSGTQANGNSFGPHLSSNGRYIVYPSDATNLVEGDTNGIKDVFLYDTETNTTTRVSLSLTGEQYSGVVVSSSFASISGDGKYVTYQYSNDLSGIYAVYLFDTTTSTTVLINNDNSRGPSISEDGRYVAYESDSSEIIEDDTNGYSDIFIYDIESGTSSRVSVSLSGVETDGDSYCGSLSSDGSFVGFTSYSTNLIDGESGTGGGNYYLAKLTESITIPTVTTSPATLVTETTVTLNATLTNDGGEESSVEFNYGPTSSYGTEVSVSGTYSTDDTFSSDITGLACDTTYHFKAYSENSAGVGEGSDQTFTTGECPRERSRVIGSSPLVVKQFLNSQSNNIIQQTVTTTIANATPIITVLNIKRVLKLNIIGLDVKELQVYLNNHGYPVSIIGPGSKGNETTKFGSLTKKAVIAFQKANGLTPDGVVGPKTLEKMK